tara:strand:- start:236 stop:445 length:210 start_codon:yes stop_codon:yes gene_type:complete
MNTFLSFIFILFLAIKGKSQIKDNHQKTKEVKTLIGDEINRNVQFFEFNLLNFSKIQIKRGFINKYIGF